LVTEVVSGILLYDAVFFFVHWAMHDIPALRTWHARHHAQKRREADGTPIVEAMDVLRHGLVDGSLQVFINIMVQRHDVWGSVKSRLARALHNIIVTWMLTESHTASPTPYVFRRWFVGVREHRRHHLGPPTKPSAATTISSLSLRYGRHHRHQQFFGYLDDLRANFTCRHKITFSTSKHQ
jgi:cholesterol 25-hydroxylase